MKRFVVMSLLVFAFVASLSAQGQCPGPQCTGFYDMTATWYPYGGQATFYTAPITNGHPQGYTNQLVYLGSYADWLDTQCYCWVNPSPNFFLWFGVALAGQCPEGTYISEDGSNGYYPDTSPPIPPTAYHVMLHDGVGIDAGDNFTQLELYEEEWTCDTYYSGPVVNYDMYPNSCVG